MVQLLGHKAGGTVKLPVGDELLDLVDCDGLVDAAPCTLILAATVAYAAADGGEGVFFLYKLESVHVLALSCKLDIALHGDVRRTSRLAGSGAGVGDILSVRAVLGIPALFRPIKVVRQIHLLILDGRFRAQLLTHLNGVICALVGALTAGNALILVDLGNIVALRKCRSVVILRNAQGKAAFRLAVADGKGVAALKRRYLMHAADLLDMAHHLVRFLLGELFAPAETDEHIGAMPHEQAEALVRIACALVHELAHTAALAGQSAQVVGV